MSNISGQVLGKATKKYKENKLDAMSREIYRLGCFKYIKTDHMGPSNSRFLRLLDSPFVIVLTKPPQQSNVEVRWIRREWILNHKSNTKQIQEGFAKIEDIISSNEVPKPYKSKIIFNMDLFNKI